MSAPLGPPAPPPRTLILCFDGTGDSFNDKNTNVIRLFSALDKQRPNEQICYYQPGIGTYVAQNSMWDPVKLKVAELLDEGFAWYLNGHINGGYRFLMDHHQPGDRIVLFGFSRGAYTARCLAGMLTKVGLLPKANEEQISFAYNAYADTSLGNEVRAKGFKAAFSRSVTIDFVGVWDTVASVGIQSKNLPFTSSNHSIKTFRQALSLDEHRVMFKPNPWHRTAPPTSSASEKHDPNSNSSIHLHPSLPPTYLQTFRRVLGKAFHGPRYDALAMPRPKRERSQTWDPEAFVLEVGTPVSPDGPVATTDCREVWFSGCHADVGGGSVSNSTINSLENAPLKWMLNEILDPAKALGIYFKPDAFADLPGFDTLVRTAGNRTSILDIHQDHFMPTGAPASNTILSVQEASVSMDANAPIHDALVEKKSWWILEYLPLSQRWQDSEGNWHKVIRMHKGRPRIIHNMNPLFHTTVRLRNTTSGYQPRATLLAGARVEYVDQ